MLVPAAGSAVTCERDGLIGVQSRQRGWQEGSYLFRLRLCGGHALALGRGVRRRIRAKSHNLSNVWLSGGMSRRNDENDGFVTSALRPDHSSS